MGQPGTERFKSSSSPQLLKALWKKWEMHFLVAAFSEGPRRKPTPFLPGCPNLYLPNLTESNIALNV